MSRGIQGIALAAAAGVLLAGAAVAQDKRADAYVKYRQSMYVVLASNFAPLGAMVQGKMPFDAQEFAKRADRVAYMADMLPEGWTAESKGGQPSKAKPGIWDNRADFDKLLQDMQSKARALSKASQAGKIEEIRPAFGALAQACKSCHDKYKQD